jgi:RNA recognition motif-containing protein
MMVVAASTEKRTTDTIEINDGTRDISAVPSKIILLRQLNHLSTEESIFNAVQSLQGVQRAILIRDKMTKMSCEFAFVEFDNVQVK